MAQKYNLHFVEAGLNQGLDARLDARRRRIRRGFVYSRLLFVRRSYGRTRIPHDGLSRSLGEVACCSQQNDQLLSGAWILQKQNSLGRCIRSWASANGRYVNVGSRTRTRLHKTGYQQNSNGFLGHYRSTAQHIFKKRGSSQYLQKNKHQQIWTQTK